MSNADIIARLTNEIMRDLGATTPEQANAMLAAGRVAERPKTKAPIGISFEKKVSKRQHAIDTVYLDVARTGKLGSLSLRAKSEGRLSHETWLEAGRLGMLHREHCKADTCQCKATE